MIFGTNYYSSMDRSYYSTPVPGGESSGKPVLSVREIGQTITEGRGKGTFIDTLNAAIRSGAGRIEFAPQGETGEPGIGVESLGKEARADLKALAKINNIDLQSVHAPPQAVGNLAGFGDNRYGEDIRSEQVNEVKKHIEFAAEVMGGGSVVIHTGEYPRSMAEKFGSEGFQAYPGEEEKSVYYLVDEKSGKIVNTIKKDEDFTIPNYRKENGRFVDIEGNPIKSLQELSEKGVLEIDKETNLPSVKTLNFSEYKDELKAAGFITEKMSDEDVARELYKEMVYSDISSNRGLAGYYSKHYESEKNEYQEALNLKKQWNSASLERRREIYLMDKKEKVEAVINQNPQLRESSKTDREGTIRRVEQMLAKSGQLPAFEEFEKEIEKDVNKSKHAMDYTENIIVGHLQKAQESESKIENIIPLSQYAQKKTSDSFIELAEYAMNMSKDPKKPIYLTPENIFPGMGYGSHPEELIELVKNARKKFAEHLVTEHIVKTDEEAAKRAATHIKATFDTQHLGMWKRHFKAKEGETPQQTTERFNKWYMNQVEKLQESGIIGNIHIVDGFGRGHTHLVANQGELPVVDAVKFLKSKGYNQAMSSEGFGDVVNVLTGTWRAFGTNIYSSAGKMADTWGGTESAYFSKVGTHPYIVGGYSPSDDFKGSPFWSGLGLE